MLLETNDVVRPTRPRKLAWVAGGVGGLAGIAALYVAYDNFSVRSLSLSADDVVISTVTRERFAPTIRVDALVAAANPVVLAAAEAGVLSEILKQNGELVQPGDVILRLSNVTLEREVADAQARIYNQLGELVAAEAQIENQIRTAEGAVRDARFRLEDAARSLGRQEQLAERGFASDATLQRVRSEHAYAQTVLADVSQSLVRTRNEGAQRLARLRQVSRRLESLSVAEGRRLSGLEVRATSTGRLTGLTASIGSPIAAAQAIGRVEDETDLEIVAQIPESRLAAIGQGASARADFAGGVASLRVASVDPTIADGRARARLTFTGRRPGALRIGQSVSVQIEAGAPRTALTVQAGPAIGANRAFVVDGNSARARVARTGERSGDRIEMLSGVSAGDRVIISTPATIDGVDLIRIGS